MLGGGIVKDAIWMAASLDVPGHLQSLQIENNGFVGAAVADEAAAKIRDESDPMDSFQIRNTADDRATVSIHDFAFRVVRDEETTRGRIECDVVPAFFAAGRSPELVFLHQLVAALPRFCEVHTSDQHYAAPHCASPHHNTLTPHSPPATHY